MRKLKLIGIGAGNPDYLTMQAINALRQVDVIFLIDKGAEKRDLLLARNDICARYMGTREYRVVEIRDPERDRAAAAYGPSVIDWHERRAALYGQVLRDELSDGECGAFLVWGDPSLYDSTLRIVDRVTANAEFEIDLEIIPGITSIQALAARHRITLNQIGGPIHVTTGRRLDDETFSAGASVVVLLDRGCAFKALADEDIDIYWGAYVGTPDEILVSGRLTEVVEEIETLRAQARARHGWIMDTYLLRKRETSSN